MDADQESKSAGVRREREAGICGRIAPLVVAAATAPSFPTSSLSSAGSMAPITAFIAGNSTGVNARKSRRNNDKMAVDAVQRRENI